MEQENDPRRTEPSFGSDEADLGSATTADSSVNFDELFDEIDRSVASSFSAPPTAAEERWVDELAATPDIDEGELIPTLPPMPVAPPSTRPTQPVLDFGAVDELVSPTPRRAEPTPTVASSGEEPMSRGVLMAGGALAALGILLGAVGMVVAFGASSQIEALQQSVDTLQTKLATAQVSGDPRVGQLQAEQAGLTSRLDEMAAKVDALAAPPQTGTDSPLAALTQRLEALEHKAVAAKASEPVKVASATKPATVTTAAKPAAVSGDWTVVLVSYGTPLQADKEQARLRKLGYQADAVKSLVDGKPWYRVRILGYKSHDAAAAAIPAIESKTGVSGAWVAHR